MTGQKNKKQMLMLQLLQNFQDLGTIMKKTDGDSGKQTHCQTTKNQDSKQNVFLTEGNMLQFPPGSQTHHQKTSSYTRASKDKEKSGNKRQSNQQRNHAATLTIDIDQVNTRNNESSSQTKTFLNS